MKNIEFHIEVEVSSSTEGGMCSFIDTYTMAKREKKDIGVRDTSKRQSYTVRIRVQLRLKV